MRLCHDGEGCVATHEDDLYKRRILRVTTRSVQRPTTSQFRAHKKLKTRSMVSMMDTLSSKGIKGLSFSPSRRHRATSSAS